MCGRFAQTKELTILISRFNFIIEDLEIRKRYNIAPGQDVAVIVKEGGVRKLKMMRWGLASFPSREKPKGGARINARGETLAAKSGLLQSFKAKRCLVPADGYYEWKKPPGTKEKIPYFFSLKNGELFAFAGIWDAWRKPEGNALYSFSIVTTTANSLAFPIHDRMPAILEKEEESAWLDPEFGDMNKLSELIKPYPAEEMETYEVSPFVNSSKNDSPECLRKFSAPRQELLF
ncbi:SOS response-associated peptidase [Candidatus Sumerlaeota bacterium]|nr:SOS response-associated peptidase [Candidatus Sumerlaeota bacterium]